MKKNVTIVKTVQTVTEKDLQHLSPGKFFSKEIISFPNPLDENEILTGEFSVYDGFAFGTAVVDGKEHEIAFEYPLLKVVNATTANVLKTNIKTYLGITEERDITPYEILRSYCNIRILESN